MTVKQNDMIAHHHSFSHFLSLSHTHTHTHTLQWVGGRVNAWQMPDTLVSVQSL